MSPAPRVVIGALVALLGLLACTRGQVQVGPAPDLPPLAATAQVLWDHAWLDRLDTASPDLLAARFPAAVVALDTLLLADGDVTSAKVAPLSLRFPAVGMEWMDAVGQGVGVRVAYDAAAVDLQITTEQGVCAARASFEPLWVHVTFAFDPAGAPGAPAPGLGALAPVGIPTLVGATTPAIEPTTCPVKLPDGLLAGLAALLQQEVRQRVAALQVGFVQDVLDEVFTPWRATGLRIPALGAGAAPLTGWISLAPASSAWLREVRVTLDGGASEPRAAAALPTSVSATAPARADCLVRLQVPVALAADLGALALSRGVLSDEALLDVPLEGLPAWLPAAPGLRVGPPLRLVAAPLALEALDVGAADGGVRLDLPGTWRVRAYGTVEGSELLLGRARLTGALRVELSVADGRPVVVAAAQGAFDDVVAPVVPLAEGWAAAALAQWARDLGTAELGFLLAAVPPTPAFMGTPRLVGLSVTDAGLEACFAPIEESP